MIITLIKNGETIKKNTDEVSELTNSGASELVRNGMMLLHFTGNRPLFSVNDRGEYSLNLPKEKLPEPSLILTGKESFSRQSGQMINAVFSTNNIADIEVQSNSIASCHPQAFLSQNQGKQHLVVVGSESCLNKWSYFICKDSIKRTPNSSLCIIKDGHMVYDSEKTSKRYMVEGVMDKFLIDDLNSEDLSRLSRIFGYSSDELKPFVKKIGQLPTAQALLAKIQENQIRQD